MSEIVHVTEVEPMDGHWIRVTFSDGSVKEIGLSALLSGGGVFAPIHDQRQIFEQVRVNPETRTVEWPGEVDLDAEVLYGRYEPVSGERIERRTIRESASPSLPASGSRPAVSPASVTPTGRPSSGSRARRS